MNSLPSQSQFALVRGIWHLCLNMKLQKNIRDFWQNRKDIKELDAEIRNLDKSVTSIRKEIDDTSPFSNVFEDAKDLTPHRETQLRNFETTLQGALEAADELQETLNSLPPRTGGLLGKIKPNTQTKVRLSSDLDAVVENIRCARMAAVYPAYYRDFGSDETMRSLSDIPQPNDLDQASGQIGFFEANKEDYEQRYSRLNGFIQSRKDTQLRSVEDRHFSALTEQILHSIGMLDRHIRGLHRIATELKLTQPRSHSRLSLSQSTPAGTAAEQARSRSATPESTSRGSVISH
jgi:hypothetical protein